MSNAAIQTDFYLYFSPAKLGEIYDRSYSLVQSYKAESEIRFGQACVAGTDLDTQVKTPSTTGQKFRGISVALWQIEQKLTGYPTTSSGVYQVGEVVGVLGRGVIWVKVSQDVQIDDPVYFVHTDANPLIVGTFRKDANVNKADLVPTGIFKKAALSGGLAVVEINLP